ncbi:MAG: hypothetical protein DBX47_04770 [Clostridiales bacterium]|nr:MAG: hypothetical protein DBX47_04770 [Clostridiales bacterium]
MIYDSIENIENYKGIHENLYRALLHIKQNKFTTSSEGGNVIDGSKLYYNFVKGAETNELCKSSFEAHRAYADIHVDIEGEEDVYVTDISEMEAATEYDAEGDYLMMKGPKTVKIHLKPGYFLVCLPNDIHMPMVAVGDKPVKITKAIYKVKI